MMKKIMMGFISLILMSCQTASQKNENDLPPEPPVCQNSEKVRACVQTMRDLSDANQWDEFEARYQELCRHESVLCERRQVSGKEAAEGIELQQPGDALFKRPKGNEAFDVFFIRTAPGSEPE